MNLEWLREFCLSMPGATEDIKYGTDLCYSIGGKIFCGTRIEGPFRTGIKCSEEDFTALTERIGIVPMPRLSVTGWIRIENKDALSRKEWKRLIALSYKYVFEKLTPKARKAIGETKK
jgi:predicted DNA-binding protein (MmcQ/YjbR family)